MFLGTEFKAVDYEDAGLNDPYFDIATVTAYFASKPVHARFLLATYLRQEPSAVEEAKLFLMKQVVLTKWALDFLKKLSQETVQQYSLTSPLVFTSTYELLSRVKSKTDLTEAEINLKSLKSLLNEIFDNFDSRRIPNAINVLSNGLTR